MKVFSGHSDSDNSVISRSPLLCNTACLLSRSNIPPSSKFKLNFVTLWQRPGYSHFSMINPCQNCLSFHIKIYIIRQMIYFLLGTASHNECFLFWLNTINMISYSISGNKEINLIDTIAALEPRSYPGKMKHCIAGGTYLVWEADFGQANIGSYTDTNNIQIVVSVCALIILTLVHKREGCS